MLPYIVVISYAKALYISGSYEDNKEKYADNVTAYDLMNLPKSDGYSLIAQATLRKI